MEHPQPSSFPFPAPSDEEAAAYIRKLVAGDKRTPSVFTIAQLAQGVVCDPRLIEREPEMVHAFSRLFAAWLSDATARAVAKAAR